MNKEPLDWMGSIRNHIIPHHTKTLIPSIYKLHWFTLGLVQSTSLIAMFTIPPSYLFPLSYSLLPTYYSILDPHTIASSFVKLGYGLFLFVMIASYGANLANIYIKAQVLYDMILL